MCRPETHQQSTDKFRSKPTKKFKKLTSCARIIPTYNHVGITVNTDNLDILLRVLDMSYIYDYTQL